MDLKLVTVGVVGFIVGVILTGILAIKFTMESYHHFFIGKLGDNVTFYRQLESGHPEQVAFYIETSLAFFVTSTEDLQDSMWVAPNDAAKKILKQAQDLQVELEANKSEN